MATTAPPSASGKGVLKRVLVGRAVASNRLEHTLLPKVLALPVFSSDALSSVAYATEEILIVLLGASMTAKHLAFPITVAICVLMVIVVSSYRQTVKAYPGGGGAYIVTKENLGVGPGLVAASALLVDYMLTVVVSTVAGVFAIVSASPGLAEHKVALSIGFVLLITLANLRGVRESGTLFAIPTYGFIVCIFIMIAIGLWRCLGGCPNAGPVEPIPDLAAAGGTVGLWVILRAFSSGSTALTGVEAISDGVPAFRRPQAKNAGQTLMIMAGLSISMFLGISWLATHINGITVSEHRSVVAQIAHTIFGGGWFFYVVQAFTASILVLAANTAFQDFPRLSMILARDHFMPRQFMNRGDRLVFSNGVIGLGLAACVVIYAFDANLTKLIQMYVVGVFTSFTLSQIGMVRRGLKLGRTEKEPTKGRRQSIVVSSIGAATTGIVLVVITATKFIKGAWLTILVMGLIIPFLLGIHRHYESIQAQLRRGLIKPGDVGANRVVLLVLDFSAATAEALGYVKSLRAREVHAVYPTSGGAVPPEVQDRWRTFGGGDTILEPLPGGARLSAVRRYVKALPRQPNDFLTVVVPEVVHGSLLWYVLRRRDLIRLKAGLLSLPNVVVADVPVVVEDGHARGVDSKPLIPQRTVALVFVSRVNDATIRAVNYAQSLDVTETRAITFELDPDAARGIEIEWFEARMGIPLDVVEAPFRDLTGPMLEEVRRFTARPDTVVTVVMPELIVAKWRHYLLHNQNALFVKRLFLFEDRVVLTSVPFVVQAKPREPQSVDA
jgi:amino acid transporter